MRRASPVIGGLGRGRAGSAGVTTHAFGRRLRSTAPVCHHQHPCRRHGGAIRDERAALDAWLCRPGDVGPGGFAMAVRTIPPLWTMRGGDAAGARGLDRQLHQPRRSGDAGADAETGARVSASVTRRPRCSRKSRMRWAFPRRSAASITSVSIISASFARCVAGKPQLRVVGDRDQPWPASTGRRSSRRHGCASCACCQPSTCSITSRQTGDRQPARRGDTRGAVIARLTRELFGGPGRERSRPGARYERYLADRSAGYMQLESGRAEGGPLPRRGPTLPATTRSR